MTRLAAYFISHGGPTLLYPGEWGSDIGAYNKIKQLGHHIVNNVKPDYILCVSAHWQSDKGNDFIEVSVPQTPDGENAVIYDFYGFPQKLYQEKFHTKGLTALSNRLVDHLKSSGLRAKTTVRGLDHGTWIPFKVAFGSELSIPLVQISLPGSDDFSYSFKLGEALNKFRENGTLIVSGMSVHNLPDLRVYGFGKPAPYATAFGRKLDSAVTQTDPVERVKQLNALVSPANIGLFRQAHPTPEHFLPLVVGVGSSLNDQVHELYTKEAGSAGWSIYLFGEDEALTGQA